MANSKYDALINSAAQNAGIDPVLFKRQLMQESGLNPEAVSPAGALGIAQIVPKWWIGKHGLTSVEDIKNPEKAIPAAAQIMGDSLKKHGSWNVALVEYNAGAGKNNKWVNAAKMGDYAILPKETQDYVRKLGTNVPAAPASAPGVISKSAPAQIPLGRSQLSTAPQDWTSPVDTNGETTYESLGAGLYTSAIGTAFRREDPLKQVLPTNYQFTESDLEAIRAANIGEAGTRFVMRNSHEQKDVQELIRLAQENRKVAGESRTLLGGLAYGIGETMGDPVSYGTMMIPGGIYAKGAQLFNGPAARIAAGSLAVASEGALSNLASEAFRETTTGTDADFAGAAASGAAFSLGILGASKGIGKGYDAITRGLTRAETSATADVLTKAGVPDARDPTVLTPMDIDQITGIDWKKQIDQPGELPLHYQDEPSVGFGRTPEGVLLQTPSGDTIHPASGVQFSSHNPLNPIHNDPVPLTRLANTPILRHSAEIAEVVANSKVQEFREMAFNLVRSSRGYTDGSSGKMGTTAQDADRALKGDHFGFQLKYDQLREDTFADPVYAGSGLDKTEMRAVFGERVGPAIERRGPTSGLTKEELEAVKVHRERYRAMAEEAVTPGARFGVIAPKLMDENVLGKDYFPVVYNENKVGVFRDSWGADVLQDRVARSFYGSYLKDAEYRLAVDEYLAGRGNDIDALEYARRAAYGIVNGGEDAMTLGQLKAMLESPELGAIGNTPDFRKMRTPFGYDHEIDLPDGSKFSVNDLRSWDLDTINTSYFNRHKGDVSVAVSTGKTPEEFSDWLTQTRAAAEADGNLKKEALAFEKIAASLYGHGIRDYGERAAAVQGILQNLAFMKSSAYMALSNYVEIASGIHKSGVGFVFRSIPGIGKAVADMQLGKKTAQTVRLAQSAAWGPALDRAILPTYAEAADRAVRRLEADSGNNAVNSVLGQLAGRTTAAAERFWTTRALVATNKAIIETARGDFFLDIAQSAHGLRKSSFVNSARAKEASISPDQLKGIQELLREAVQFDKDGNMVSVNAQLLSRDPRASHLRRYGQFWSERVIQQHNIGSTFRWSHLPMVGLATQFMSFVTRSINAKLIRSTADVFQNGNVDEAISMMIVAPALSAIGYTGIAYLQSQKFATESDRKKFLKERLGDKDDIGPMVAGSVKRMSYMGGPSWLYDTVGSTSFAQQIAPEVFQYAGFGKTSTEAKLKREKQAQPGAVGGFLGDTIEQAPAIKMADSLAALMATPARNAMAGDDYAEIERATKATRKAWAGIIPNDPLTQRIYQELISED